MNRKACENAHFYEPLKSERNLNIHVTFSLERTMKRENFYEIYENFFIDEVSGVYSEIPN